MNQVKTVQVQDRLIIADGKGPLRYVDLTTNKVHVYKPPKQNLYKRILERIKMRKYVEVTAVKIDSPIQPRVGYPNLWAAPGYGFDEEMYKNVCLWYDHTLRAMKGHDVRHCKWSFDGQIWKHNKLPKVYDLTKGEQPITGIELTGANKVTEIEVGNG